MTKLQELIKNSNHTNTDIAYALGISDMSLYRKATGKSQLKRGEMKIISDMLNISEEDQEKIIEELRRQ